MMNKIKVNFILQYLSLLSTSLCPPLGQTKVSSSSKDEEKGKESEKKDNEAAEKGRLILMN